MQNDKIRVMRKILLTNLRERCMFCVSPYILKSVQWEISKSFPDTHT